MSDTDLEDDEKFERMIRRFREDMTAMHGFTFKEAGAVVYGEIKREFDQRAKARRAKFRVIDGEIGQKAKPK